MADFQPVLVDEEGVSLPYKEGQMILATKPFSDGEQAYSVGVYADIGGTRQRMTTQGEQGPKGDAGPVGPQGSIGPQGVMGPRGERGAQGVRGEQGIQGVQGLQGVQGPVGPQGLQGQPGDVRKWYPSIAAMEADFDNPDLPTNALVGINTDGDADDGKLYYKGASEFVFITQIQGVQGPQGPQGPQGVQGIQGAQGEQGKCGAIQITAKAPTGYFIQPSEYTVMDGSFPDTSYLVLITEETEGSPFEVGDVYSLLTVEENGAIELHTKVCSLKGDKGFGTEALSVAVSAAGDSLIDLINFGATSEGKCVWFQIVSNGSLALRCTDSLNPTAKMDGYILWGAVIYTSSKFVYRITAPYNSENTVHVITGIPEITFAGGAPGMTLPVSIFKFSNR